MVRDEIYDGGVSVQKKNFENERKARHQTRSLKWYRTHPSKIDCFSHSRCKRYGSCKCGACEGCHDDGVERGGLRRLVEQEKAYGDFGGILDDIHKRMHQRLRTTIRSLKEVMVAHMGSISKRGYSRRLDSIPAIGGLCVRRKREKEEEERYCDDEYVTK